MIVGIAQAPFKPQTWLQPLPTVASYRALRALGMDGLRLQFDVSIASPTPGVWDTSLFRSWITPAFAAGMRINANYCIGQQLPHMDAAFHEKAAFRFAREFGPMIESYSFGNEPGPDAQAYEGEDGPTAERDYMRDVYMPMCIAFVRGIQRPIPQAWIGGCDADSAGIQLDYTEHCDAQLLAPLPCDEELVHPYGEVGGGDYATLEAFAKVRSRRPWGISEVDHQQFESAKLRGEHTAFVFRTNGASEATSVLQGALARLRPTPDETMALVELLRKVGRDYRDCTRFVLNQPDYFFERVKIDGVPECCSFYLPDPIVSAGGRAFAAAIAEINGPVDPIRTTMPFCRAMQAVTDKAAKKAARKSKVRS